jgi:hypothetical protein
MSGTGFETVNPILQGLKRGDEGGDLSLELNDTLGGGRGLGGADFEPVMLRE